MKSSTISDISSFSVSLFNSLPSIENAFDSSSKVTEEQWVTISQIFEATTLSKNYKLVLLHRHQSLRENEVMFSKAENSEQRLCISKPIKRSEVQTNSNVIPFIWKFDENGMTMPLGFTTENSESTLEITDAEFQDNCNILAKTLHDLDLINVFGISRYLTYGKSLENDSKVWVEDTNVETQENISKLQDLSENFTSNVSCSYCGSFNRQPIPTAWRFTESIIKCTDTCMTCAHCGNHVDPKVVTPGKIFENPDQPQSVPATEPEKIEKPEQS